MMLFVGQPLTLGLSNMSNISSCKKSKLFSNCVLIFPTLCNYGWLLGGGVRKETICCNDCLNFSFIFCIEGHSLIYLYRLFVSSWKVVLIHLFQNCCCLVISCSIIDVRTQTPGWYPVLDTRLACVRPCVGLRAPPWILKSGGLETSGQSPYS